MSLLNTDSKANLFQVMPAKDTPLKSIVFDLGDVVFTKSNLQQAKTLIPLIFQHPSLLYTLCTQDIKKIVFDMLRNVPAQSCPVNMPMYNCQEQMPQIMVDWMTGRSSQEVQKLINEHIDQAPYTKPEQKLLKRIALQIFDPINFTDCLVLEQPMFKLISALKKQGYKLYVLSNWDHESFPIMQEKYRHLFSLFDGIMISGDHNTGKPDIGFYQKLLTTYEIIAQECIFIDDEPFNTKAAQSINICSITHTSMHNLYLELTTLGILKKLDDSTTIS